ncbi:hypothetical protein [Cyanobium gracile]|uniref:Glycosyltransferase RgtA/B/C/D-like domain-containing protein n=1 Tax=Cyanobium gracile UHCC 0281 TaxID=3110309 RepID=A0ABU5SSK9_9CYAN|nr:hypothetical protein [Cyanobium gracile]MEA5441469.1 hypothetical protein [Cyanobium gracile UHCC 0281]
MASLALASGVKSLRTPLPMPRAMVVTKSMVYSLVVATAGAFLKNHTPNYGWCRSIPDLRALLSKSHAELAFQTVTSVMRPSLHIEKELGHACGEACLNLYYDLAYFSALLFGVLLLSRTLFRILQSPTQLPHEQRWARWILFILPVYIILFSGGSFVDALYPASVIGLLALIHLGSGKRVTVPVGASICLLALFFAFSADMSRPYAPYILVFILLSSVLNRKLLVASGLLLGLLLASPYHINQHRLINTFMLTNYTGCNLAEVFINAPNIKGGIDMSVHSGIEVAEYCKENQQIIKNYILSDPLSAMKDVLEPQRLARIVFPAPFSPWKYVRLPSPAGLEEALQWLMWVALGIFLYYPLLRMILANLWQSVSKRALVFSAFACFAPLLFTIVGNGGQEAGRLSLAYILPMAFFYSWLQLKRL